MGEQYERAPRDEEVAQQPSRNGGSPRGEGSGTWCGIALHSQSYTLSGTLRGDGTASPRVVGWRLRSPNDSTSYPEVPEEESD